MDLYRKVKYALGVALTLNGATLVAWLNGEITGKQALVTVVTTDLPVVAAYLTSETKA